MISSTRGSHHAVGALLAGIVLIYPIQPSTAGAANADDGSDNPRRVLLVVDTTFDDQPDAIITARGAAAPDCVNGTVTDTFFRSDPPLDAVPPNVFRVRIVVGKAFHCSGGDIQATLRVQLNLRTTNTNGSWMITGGTGRYLGIEGHGTIAGRGNFGGVIDTYRGTVEFD